MSNSPVIDITTPSGASVTLRSPELLKNRERRVIMVEIEKILMNPEGEVATPLTRQNDYMLTVIRHLVVAWSYRAEDGTPLALPTEQNDTTQDLNAAETGAIWAVLEDELAPLYPNFRPTVKSVDEDPKAGATTES